MYDFNKVYLKHITLKDFFIKGLEEGIELFSLLDYKGRCYYGISKLNNSLDIDKYPHYWSMAAFLNEIDCKELEKWEVTGYRKDSKMHIVEIRIERITPDKPKQIGHVEYVYGLHGDIYDQNRRSYVYKKAPDKIQKIILNGPATIIFWKDDTKTIVKCDDEDTIDKEKGILYAAVKKLSTKETYNDILRSIELLNNGNDFLSGITYKEV